MKRLLYIFFCFSLFGFTQEAIKAELKETTDIKAETLFGVDTFGTLYYSDEGGSFYKKTTDTIISYANFQLGKITSANPFNPLKINLFYQDFNTVIVLDNRLAEITKIDFNTIEDYKNVSLVSTGYDNTIWIFNQDLQRLELYDYLNNKTRVKTVPIQSDVISLKSDYNYCYLLTDSFLYVYNYSGSLLRKITNSGLTEMAFSKANLVLKSKNELFLLPKNDDKLKSISGIDLLINQFLVTNETLYIYDDEKLRRYQLKSQ
ncbi:hypothetical protein BTO05_06850 [Winogradskyella sp. PC-19]|uniref:hypothetical protein n=1 Tax=unclassified Winogradskyella TaxID=2615021 RepID=UPI000B3CC61C|nr:MULTISPECIES: hypothetical protein [unclassified Winogradskyella]ARV09370.1 hypothetical protein BTO05_06850 [Winogradskyella sp. PC-19]RZN76454.1 MAG: hypothetical protein EVB12_06460 [Winogradskyella sp.]